ncbi:BC1872 family protein [Paenibacillus sp. CAU 1782]
MLTEQQIRDMDPGRELDRLIATQIMGCEIDERIDIYFQGKKWSPIPEYSTDISAAWEVVEKCNEVKVKRYETMGGHCYFCKIEVESTEGWDEVIETGDTAPEAICKAALIAHMRGGSGD